MQKTSFNIAPALWRCIALLLIWIAAQDATEKTGMMLAAALCLVLLDSFLIIVTRKGLIHHLKNS